MDQVVETECTQDAADSDEEAHEDKEPVMGGDPEDAPKKYTEKADCTDATSFVKNGFGIRFLPLTCMKCDLFIQVQISNSLQHWILGMVNLDIIHKCLVSCLRFCV